MSLFEFNKPLEVPTKEELKKALQSIKYQKQEEDLIEKSAMEQNEKEITLEDKKVIDLPEKVYILKVSLMNGTVLMTQEISVFKSKELAEKVKKAVEKENESENYKYVSLSIVLEEANLYSDEKTVPILKNQNKDEK